MIPMRTVFLAATRLPCRVSVPLFAVCYERSYETHDCVLDPYTSEQAKKHAAEILEAAGYVVEQPSGVSADEHETRVLAGYKAALSSKSVLWQRGVDWF
jgi:hypothetical protein